MHSTLGYAKIPAIRTLRNLAAGSTIVMGYRTYEVYDLLEKSPRTSER